MHWQIGPFVVEFIEDQDQIRGAQSPITRGIHREMDSKDSFSELTMKYPQFTVCSVVDFSTEEEKAFPRRILPIKSRRRGFKAHFGELTFRMPYLQLPRSPQLRASKNIW